MSTTILSLGVLRSDDGAWVILKPTDESGVFRVREASYSIKLRRGMHVRSSLPLEQAVSMAGPNITLVKPSDLQVRCCGEWLPYKDYLEARQLAERVRRRPEIKKLLERAA